MYNSSFDEYEPDEPLMAVHRMPSRGFSSRSSSRSTTSSNNSGRGNLPFVTLTSPPLRSSRKAGCNCSCCSPSSPAFQPLIETLTTWIGVLLMVAGVVGLVAALLRRLHPPPGPPVLTLQVFNKTVLMPGDDVSITFGIRLRPGSPSCVQNLCWSETEEGATGLEVYRDVATRVHFRVENLLSEPTLLHWHGLVVPFHQDGVPGITQSPIAAGHTASYDFPLHENQTGTFFMHSHYSWQHQQGASAFLLVLESKTAAPSPRDVVIMLEDFMPPNPACTAGDASKCNPLIPHEPSRAEVGWNGDELNTLDGTVALNPCVCPVLTGYFGLRQCSCSGVPAVGASCSAEQCASYRGNCSTPCPDVSNARLNDTNDEAFNMCRYQPEQQPSLRWLHTRYQKWWFMYTLLLMNGGNLGDPRRVSVVPGEWLRLRFINSAGSSCFWLSTPGLSTEVLAVDGEDVVRGVHVTNGTQVPLCVGQRADLLLQVPDVDNATYPVLAQWQGERNQTGMLLVAGDGGMSAFGHQGTGLSSLADERAPLIDFEFESRLSAQHPLAHQPVNVTHTVNLTGGWLHTFSLNRANWFLPPAVALPPGFHTGQGGMLTTTTAPWVPNPRPLAVKGGQRVCVVIENQSHVGHPMHLHGHSFQVVALDGVKVSGAMRDTVQIPPRCHNVTVCFDTHRQPASEWLLHCHMSEHLANGMVTSVVYA